MKYLEKSFTLPASQGITQEAWDQIWNTPQATESAHRVSDTVALGVRQCPNCHADISSYRHEETCLSFAEID